MRFGRTAWDELSSRTRDVRRSLSSQVFASFWPPKTVGVALAAALVFLLLASAQVVLPPAGDIAPNDVDSPAEAVAMVPAPEEGDRSPGDGAGNGYPAAQPPAEETAVATEMVEEGAGDLAGAEAEEPAAPAPAAAPEAEEPAAQRPEPSTRGGAREPKTIVIDAGHGGSDSGATARAPDGRTVVEKELNLKVALACAEMLREAGHRVVLTRTGDTAVSLQQRIDVANRERADLFVSIHFNAAKPGVRGLEVFYNANRPFWAQSKLLAQRIYDRLLDAIRSTGYNIVERGVKRDSQATGGPPFYLLGPQSGTIKRASEMPAALGEAVFLTYPEEARLCQDDDFLLGLARAYADGILDYLE